MNARIALWVSAVIILGMAPGCFSTYTDSVYAGHFESAFLPYGRAESAPAGPARNTPKVFPEPSLPMAPSVAEVCRRNATNPYSNPNHSIEFASHARIPLPAPPSLDTVERLAVRDYAVGPCRTSRRHVGTHETRPDQRAQCPDRGGDSQSKAKVDPQRAGQGDRMHGKSDTRSDRN